MVILLLQVVLGLDLFVGCFDAFVFGDKEWFGGLGEVLKSIDFRIMISLSF